MEAAELSVGLKRLKEVRELLWRSFGSFNFLLILICGV